MISDQDLEQQFANAINKESKLQTAQPCWNSSTAHAGAHIYSGQKQTGFNIPAWKAFGQSDAVDIDLPVHIPLFFCSLNPRHILSLTAKTSALGYCRALGEVAHNISGTWANIEGLVGTSSVPTDVNPKHHHNKGGILESICFCPCNRCNRQQFQRKKKCSHYNSVHFSTTDTERKVWFVSLPFNHTLPCTPHIKFISAADLQL